jgi:hypothetical protein
MGAIKWTDALTAIGTMMAAVGTIVTLVFFGLQLRIQRQASTSSLAALSAQINAQTEQTKQLAEQAQAQTKQARIAAAAAELTVNLGVMVRLQEVLYEIADDEDTWKYVWGGSPSIPADPPAPPGPPDPPDCRRPILGTWAMLDVLSIALTAAEQLPDFSRNAADDWVQYSLDTLGQSVNLRNALGSDEGKAYWPELRTVLDAYKNGVRNVADFDRRTVL